MPPFRDILLGALTLLSAVVLLALPIGYAASVYFQISRGNQNATGINFRSLHLGVGEGRVVAYTDHVTAAIPGLPGVGWHLNVHGPRWRAPSLRRSLWEFDAHRLAVPAPGASAFLLAAPIWVVALPFMVLPGRWLFRRRRRDEPRGFGVLTGEPVRVP